MSTCTFIPESMTAGTFRETETEHLRFSHADEQHLLQVQSNANLLQWLLTGAYLYEEIITGNHT